MDYELDGDRGADTVFIAAHGAGGHMRDRAMLELSRALVSPSIAIVRFNFPYRDRNSGRPDPMPVLEEHFATVVDAVRRDLAPKRVVIGGRSMGGRAASMLGAKDFACDGLLLLAYPLHPPGKPDKLRDAHLPAIRVPVLCLNGTRDEFCTPELMTRAIAGLANWRMHWLHGADHSFRVRKVDGRTNAEVMAEVSATVQSWLKTEKQ